MKKAIALLALSIALVLSLAACGGEGNNKPVHIHEFGEWIITRSATCTADGTQTRYCSCGEKQTEVIVALGHTPGEAVVEDKVDATYDADGSYKSVVYCTTCNEKISEETHKIPMLKHTPAEAIEENRIEATCYSEGSYDTVVYCKDCGAEIERAKHTVPIVEHTPAEAVEENRINATYEKDGSYQLVVYCSASGCGAELERTTHTLDMLVHHPGSAVVENEVAATCYAEGSYDEVVYCLDEDCGHKELSRKTVTVSMLAHTPAEAVVENLVSATCTANGSYDEVVYCSVENCKVQISRTTKVIDALGHTATEWIIDKNAEETESGLKHQVCLICKATIKTETIPPLKPDIAEGSSYDYKWRINYYGVLTIEFTSSSVTIRANSPWAEYKDRITEIKFSGNYSGMDIGANAFENYPSLRKVDFAYTVDTIGNYAFYNCPNLQSAFIYAMNVGKYAFANCKSLQWLAFEWDRYYTSIDAYAFSNCTSLKNIYIYGSSYISDSPSFATTAFSGVTANVNYPKGITIYNSVKNNYGGTLTWVETTSGVCGPNAYWNIKNNKLTVSGTGSIVDLFSGSKYPWYPSKDSITSIEIQDGITYIPTYTFEYMDSAETVTLPNTITILNCNAFNDCRSLNNLHIPKSITLIQNNFNRCDVLSTFYYEGTKEEWLSIDGISNVYMWESCSRVVHFTNEKNSEELKYTLSPDETYYIVSCAGTFSSTTLQIPSTYNGKPVKEIGAYGFYDSDSLTSVIIPNTIVSIGSYAFTDCDNLNNVEIPDSVTTIRKYAFQGCDGLIEMIIPGSVASVSDNVFEGCSNLTSVTIQNGVTAINYEAFEYCSSLNNIVISDSVINIGSSAFSGCSSLTSVVIPDSVTSIGNEAFYDCSSLTSVVIPDSVTSIGNYAFRGCSSLESVVIGGSVTSIGKCAFYNCKSLASVVIPDSVTSIGDWAFSGCTGLTSVVIGDSVTSIGYEAFGGCTVLKDVYYTGTAAEWAKISIDGGNYDLTSATKHYNYVPAN